MASTLINRNDFTQGDPGGTNSVRHIQWVHEDLSQSHRQSTALTLTPKSGQPEHPHLRRKRWRPRIYSSDEARRVEKVRKNRIRRQAIAAAAREAYFHSVYN